MVLKSIQNPIGHTIGSPNPNSNTAVEKLSPLEILMNDKCIRVCFGGLEGREGLLREGMRKH
jgi:hypothetical protein